MLDLMLAVVHGWDFIERYRALTGGQEISPTSLSVQQGCTARKLTHHFRGYKALVPTCRPSPGSSV